MRPVQIVLQLIEMLSAHQPAGVTELSNLTGLPRSTTQRALTALHKGGWIEAVDERRGLWSLSLRALMAAGLAAETHGTLRNVAIPIMEELRRSTEETIHLMVRQGNRVVLVERLDGILPVDQFRPFGSDAPLVLTATGKAILSTLPSRIVDAIAKLPTELRPRQKPVDPEQLARELSHVRTLGYAMTLGGNRHNVGAVGAAITDREQGEGFAAISASGPLPRMTAERCGDFGPLVAEAARRISQELRPIGRPKVAARAANPRRVRPARV